MWLPRSIQGTECLDGVSTPKGRYHFLGLDLLPPLEGSNSLVQASTLITFYSAVFLMVQLGPYLWKTYGEVFEEVLNIGSALRQLGAEPVRSHLTSI